jgi:hypothetical protein
MSARRMVSALAFAAMLACWPLCAPSAASVSFEPFQLAATDPALNLQAEMAYEPALSADGNYVAFTGRVASKPGVYRKNLATGELAVVALGTGAGAPSISAGGRYVSFTTFDYPYTLANPRTGKPEAGVPLPDLCTRVYRRDMTEMGPEPLQPGPESSYNLVSALDGSEEPLTYDSTTTESEGAIFDRKCTGVGSGAAGRVAMSADGSKVAFTVLGNSNLTGKCTVKESTSAGELEITTKVVACPTPPNQIAVREFNTNPDPPNAPATKLVSVEERTGKPVVHGAALSGKPSIDHQILPSKQEVQQSNDKASTAAISGDGNAVAWMGINVGAQSPADNVAPKDPGEYPEEYAEPLWREIADPGAKTRRVLAGELRGCPSACPGGLDLEWNNELPPADTGAPFHGPVRGSYVEPQPSGSVEPFREVEAVTPQLSADGTMVAILSTQPDYGRIPNLTLGERGKKPTANAFVVNMTGGPTREQAITRLTEWGSTNFEQAALDGAIGHLVISGDGSRVAFNTARSVFPLAPPALVTAPVQAVTGQLYVANLQAGTLAFASQGYNGEPANQGVDALALSANGRTIALASGSTNLLPGVVNDGKDVYLTREEDSPEVPGQQTITALPGGPPGDLGWSISATASPGPGGSLLIDVSVPGAGRLAASANVPVPVTSPASGSRRGRPRPHGSRRAARAAKVTRHGVTVIATRQVARAATTSTTEGLLQLRLVPVARYRSLAGAKGGLYATITVTFAAPGHHTLTQTLQASFPRPRSRPRASKRTSGSPPRKGHG